MVVTDRGNTCASAGGIGLATVLIALIFLFVWPGPFRYQYIRPASDCPGLMRIDRITGKPYAWSKGKYEAIHELEPNGWSTEMKKVD